MKHIRSILQKFGPLVVITALLLGAFAVQVAMANVTPDSMAQVRKQFVVTALRVERTENSRHSSNSQGATHSGAEIQSGDDNVGQNPVMEPGDDHGMDATEVESTETVESTRIGKTATPTSVETESQLKSVKTSLTATPVVENTPGSDDDNPADNDDNGQEMEEHAGQVEFQGQITAMNGDTWTINNMVVLISSATEIKGSPKVGDMVKVEGLTLADGSVQASQIEAKHAENKHADRTPTSSVTATPGEDGTPTATPTSTSTSVSTPVDDHGGDGGGGHDGGGHDGGGHH